jgi:hypothetical protein
MSIEYSIICDSCSRIINATSKGAGVARREMREQDLGRTVGKQDQCAGCRAEGRPIEHGGR